MQTRISAQVINLELINEQPDLSIILHKLLTQYISHESQTELHAKKHYLVDGQAYTLSHHLKKRMAPNIRLISCVATLPELNENTNKNDFVGEVFTLASGYCYYQNKSMLLKSRAVSQPSAPEDMRTLEDRKNTIYNTLRAIDPLAKLPPEKTTWFTSNPLPHLLEKNELLSSADADFFSDFSSQLENKCLLWEDRLKYHEEKIKQHALVKETRLNPADLKPDDEITPIFGEFLALAAKCNLKSISGDIPIPFRGKRLSFANHLYLRKKTKGQTCYDVLEAKNMGQGWTSAIKRVLCVLIFDENHQLISSKPPKNKRVYKIAKKNESLTDETERSAHINYLHVKNSCYSSFSMWELPGVTLHQYMHHLKRIKCAERGQALLLLCWKSYEALDLFIAKNMHLNQRHGDIKPNNIMIDTENECLTQLSVKFIDFNPHHRSIIFSPYIIKLPKDSLQKYDAYSLGRTLAQVFGDTHPIWLSRARGPFEYFHNKPIAHLLSHLFKLFDYYKEDGVFSEATVTQLKTLFTDIHTFESRTYPSAEQISNAFKAIYNQHCEALDRHAERTLMNFS